MTGFIEVRTAVSSKEKADEIAGQLVERRLAACVQMLQIESTYRWKDKVCKEKEWLCLIRTRDIRFDEVAEAIKGLHDYELPEIITLPIVGSSPDYLRWMTDGTA